MRVPPAPSPETIRRLLKLLEPWRLLTRPWFEGLERVPDERPLLFVGNHTLIGVLDVPLLYAELFHRRGVMLRGLGDHRHFVVPLWGRLVRRLGVVDGTRENCAALMRAGEAVLVFPGGAREVTKRKGEKYQLFWKERLGFAHMAIRHGCTIVPFAAVGVEDMYDLVVDGDELLATPLGRAARALGVKEDFVPPLVRGLGPTPLPRPERLYFHVGEPISTKRYGGVDDPASCREVRDLTRAAVESGIERLRRVREQDPDRGFDGVVRRFLEVG